MTTPEGYLELIDVKYSEAKAKRQSRFNVEWGKWSVTMNRVLRRLTEGKNKNDTEIMKLRYVFIYWSLKSELLELHYKYKLFRKKRKKELVENAKDIKEIILTGNGLQPLSQDEVIAQMVERSLKK